MVVSLIPFGNNQGRQVIPCSSCHKAFTSLDFGEWFIFFHQEGGLVGLAGEIASCEHCGSKNSLKVQTFASKQAAEEAVQKYLELIKQEGERAALEGRQPKLPFPLFRYLPVPFLRYILASANLGKSS